MSHSDMLRSSDARDAMRLVGEIRDVAADPLAWRAHLARGLVKLIDGNVGMSIEAYGWGEGPRPRVPVLVDLGWRGDAERRDFYDYSNTERFEVDPMILASIGKHTRPYTVRREEWVDDASWYRAANVSVGRRFADVDGSIASSRPLPAPCGSNGTDHLAIHRPWRAKRFTLRERRIVRLVHDGVSELFTGRTGDTLAALARDLPPQLRRVHTCMLDGLGEKEIASTMHLRRHTIHFYVRLLYERLGVRSHLELLARHTREKDGRPALLGDPAPVLPFLAARPETEFLA